MGWKLLGTTLIEKSPLSATGLVGYQRHTSLSRMIFANTCLAASISDTGK